MTEQTIDLIITKGKTFSQAFLCAEDDQYVYRKIATLASAAPAQIAVAGHGLPAGWPARIESVKAPLELNTPEDEWLIPAVINDGVLEINHLNLQGAKPFSGPGVLVYPKPIDITGWTARMQVRDRIGGAVLLNFSSNPGDAPDGTITVDTAGSALVIGLSADKTAAISWSRAVYDIEAARPDGSVIGIVSPSSIIVKQEVTL